MSEHANKLAGEIAGYINAIQSELHHNGTTSTAELAALIDAQYGPMVELASYLVTIKGYADGGKELVSNQGQALDGYSELAEYRGAIDRLSAALAELERK